MLLRVAAQLVQVAADGVPAVPLAEHPAQPAPAISAVVSPPAARRASATWEAAARPGWQQQNTVTQLAALPYELEREVTGSLVDPLIATVHRIGGRAGRKVTEELISAFPKVASQENILFAIAGACLAHPSGAVRGVVCPAVRGAEAAPRELVHEYKTNGPACRRTARTTLRACREQRGILARCLAAPAIRAARTVLAAGRDAARRTGSPDRAVARDRAGDGAAPPFTAPASPAPAHCGHRGRGGRPGAAGCRAAG